MAKRQMGPGGPIYDYDGRAALDAPHTNISKVKVVKVNINIASIAVDSGLDVTAALPAGTCSARAICLAVNAPPALEANVGIGTGRVTAVDEVKFHAFNLSAAAIDPAAADYEFVILEP